MTHRYEVQQETDGLWRIVDIFSGLPVERDGGLLIGLLLDEADDLLDIVENLDRQHRRAWGMP
ncbi:hypothetical protein [Aminobacter aminovorans]|uniref:Uncharacterized protein n=1 Tax=Aminobacter aminovorans TaxID=83263 RepID=A0AAC8YQ89_AMIAI|nr:hypothetical protein [Aminobacter aminovorans]AMS42483.1 hypothetical protein AA2016_3561 [Aminobacter aminovorans]MBB3707794.1 hypothetical protein [Aminobacter aminovorans]